MTMTDSIPPRAAERVPFAAQLMVVRGTAAWFVDLIDLSEGGCGVFRPEDCALQQDHVVQLFFYTQNNAPSVMVPARVARVAERQIGFEYHELQAVPPVTQSR